MVTREIRHLSLPDARVHHRPRGDEENGSGPSPEPFPVDTNSVAFDEAVLVRLPRANQGRASSTMLNGVSAARRTR